MAIRNIRQEGDEILKNKYRWRIILKGKLTNKLIDIINLSISNINSKTTRIIVDTNPTNLN